MLLICWYHQILSIQRQVKMIHYEKNDIVLIFPENIDCGYMLELLTSTHNLCFRAKIMYTPVNPNFTVQKVGVRGSGIHRH